MKRECNAYWYRFAVSQDLRAGAGSAVHKIRNALVHSHANVPTDESQAAMLAASSVDKWAYFRVTLTMNTNRI